MKKHILETGISICLAFNSFMAMTQTQKGEDIDGETTGDRSGWAVSMPDANTVAIGAPQNDANGGSSGQVRIYNWSGSSWTQKGADIDGDAAGDLFGSTVYMPDENTVAIGAPQNDEADVDAGQVKIFEWGGTAWTQKGNAILGDSTDGFFGGLFGSSVSMPDPNSIVIGAAWYDNTGSFSGQVKVFDWNGTEWIQRGGSINGSAYSYTGSIVRMPSSNVIGIVTQGATVGNKGMVRIFEWDGSQWLLKGNPIEGENVGDLSGSSMDMPDENTVAIGAVENDGGFSQGGHVRIYEWNGVAWVQKGSDIDGEAAGDESGNSVSMPDANTIAIGATLNDGNGTQSGHVRVFNWNGTDWEQVGIDIDGETAMDQSGYSVSMPDANTVAIGSIQNDAINGPDFANEAGHVRIYNLNGGTAGISKKIGEGDLSLYPNPTTSVLNIETKENITIKIVNSLGETIITNYLIAGFNTIKVDNLNPGIYFIHGENGKTIKFVKE